MNLYEDDKFILSIKEESVFVQLRQDGLTMKDFQNVLSCYPRIELKNFSALQQVFSHFTNQAVPIGSWRPIVECVVSPDGMEAKIRIFQTQEELAGNLEMLTIILQALEDNGVREGFLMEALRGPFIPQKWIVVAQGIQPISGQNAILNYLQPSEKKPLLKSDGNTNFYEMNFIDEIHAGAWLGEKIPATMGTTGRTVTGKIIPALPGKDQALRYDPKTVTETKEGNKFVLRASIDGAMEWQNGRIGVINRLLIPGDVGVGTGNIDFAGAVIIQGTVQDTFSVVAGKDLSILSPLGVGAVDRIVSKEGDIYLSGGVYGQGKAVIEAKGNIYAKHANDCVMRAGKEIHIGYYAMGSELQAKVIILDKDRGKLIGGKVVAESQVVAAYIGNVYERSTHVSVSGFNRAEIREKLEILLAEYKVKRISLEKLLRLLDAYNVISEPLDEQTQEEYDNALATQQHLENELYQIESVVKSWSALLKTRGEGAVLISKAAYPKTHLIIKNSKKIVETETKGTFYITEDQLFFE